MSRATATRLPMTGAAIQALEEVDVIEEAAGDVASPREGTELDVISESGTTIALLPKAPDACDGGPFRDALSRVLAGESCAIDGVACSTDELV